MTSPVKERKITVKESVLIAFSNMGSEFSVINLVAEVRLIAGRPALMDGTITRELRDLKSIGEIDYEIINQTKGIYRKLKEWNDPTMRNQLSLF